MPLTKTKLTIKTDAIGENQAFGSLLTDLSKEFNCVCRDLLIAKLHPYGLVMSSLNLLPDYLSNCQQKFKVDSFFYSSEEILSGVP